MTRGVPVVPPGDASIVVWGIAASGRVDRPVLPHAADQGRSTIGRAREGRAVRLAYRSGMSLPTLDATADRSSPFGQLHSLVADPTVTDVVANGPRGVWVDRGNGMEPVPIVLTEAELRSLAVRLIAVGGRHLDEAAPVVDVRVGDGVRVHAVLPPLATEGTCLSIRLPRARPPSIDELAESGMLDAPAAEVLRGLVRARANMLVTGAAGSGNTTRHI